MKPKKKVFTRNGRLFFPNSNIDLRSDAHQSQIIGGGADEDHTQIVGGIQSNYWVDISSPSPRVSAFLVTANAATTTLFLGGQCLFLGGPKFLGWSTFLQVLC